MLQNISIKELDKISNPLIIDIRNIENYNNNHIPGAINIPYSNLILNPKKYLDKTKKYYIYCQRGITSKTVCISLHNLGYNVYNIIGGYEEWLLNK